MSDWSSCASADTLTGLEEAELNLALKILDQRQVFPHESGWDPWDDEIRTTHEKLRAARRERLTAVDDSNTQIHQGGILRVLGPSGTGKTTLVKLPFTLVLLAGETTTVNRYDLVEGEEKVSPPLHLSFSILKPYDWHSQVGDRP